MAIAIVGSATGYSGSAANVSGSNAFTVTTTVLSGANFMVCMTAGLVDGFNAVSSLTFSGTTLTALRQDRAIVANYDPSSGIFYLVNPPVGTYGLVVNLGASAREGVAVTSLILSGVDTVTPMDVAGGVGRTQTSGTSLSNTITTVATNAWIIQSVSDKGSTAGITQDNGQTEIADAEVVGTNATISYAFSYLGPVATPGSQTLGVSSLNNVGSTMSLASIKPSATTISSMALMGIGT